MIVMGRALPSMPIPFIRRRLAALESVAAWSTISNYSPFTPVEVEALAEKARTGSALTRLEVLRIERQSPIVQGEFVVTG
jgi:hypothetical protein